MSALPAVGPVTDGDLIARLHRRVGEQLHGAHEAAEADGGRLDREDERELARSLVLGEMATLATEALHRGEPPISDEERAAIVQEVLDHLLGLGRLQPLLDDPTVRDIHISGHDGVWIHTRDGRKVRGEPVAASDEDLITLVATAARRIGRSERRWDYAEPELNLPLPGGDRLHALMAVSGRPTVTIRRHDFAICRVDQLVEREVMDDLLADFLRAAVKARANIIVAGGTGTGKTTTLRCLLNEIGPDERLITVEDALEIGIERFRDLHPDHVTLESRDANTEGAGEFGLPALVRAALRMDPDRVIVGEVRGAEVLPMLLAMSQGNDGSMCSIHADSSRGVFNRLAMYGAMTTERLSPETTNLLVANAINLVLHLGWVDGARRVTSVREVTGTVEQSHVVSNELWRPHGTGAGVPAAPPSSALADRLGRSGFDVGRLATAPGYLR